MSTTTQARPDALSAATGAQPQPYHSSRKHDLAGFRARLDAARRRARWPLPQNRRPDHA